MTREEEIKALEAIQEQVSEFKKILGDAAKKADFDTIEKDLKALKDGLGDWSGEKITKSMDGINTQLKELHDLVCEVKEEQQMQKDKSGEGRKKGDFVSKEDIDAFIKATFDEKGRKTHANASIQIKAPEVFGYPQFFEGAEGTQVDAFTGRFVDPELYQRRRKRNLILDHFAIMSIEVPKLIYLEKIEEGDDNPTAGDPGGADWIVSGAPKPRRSFRVTTGEVEAKKVAIFGTVEDKLLRDVASLENWIREDFLDEMREKYNDGLLNNNPAVNEDAPLGLKTNAILYEATPAFDENVVDPNYIDAIIAAIAYMADLKESPGRVFVATDVFYAIHALKASDGKYLNNNLVYVNALGQLFIAGVRVIEADSDDIPSTHVLVVAQDPGFKIRNYGPMVFERGLNGEDFREDKTSYRGFQEVLSYIPQHRENTVMYDTWANILTAIEVPAPAP